MEKVKESTDLPTRSGVASDQVRTILGSDTTFSGVLVFDGKVRVDGSFEGEIRAPQGILIVGGSALVEGATHVRSLIVLGGIVRGTIKANEAVEIHHGATVEADVETDVLLVDRGGVLSGRCNMEAQSLYESSSQESAPRSDPDHNAEMVHVVETESVETDNEAEMNEETTTN